MNIRCVVCNVTDLIERLNFFLLLYFCHSTIPERKDYRSDIVRGCVVVSMSVREMSLIGFTFTCMTKIAGVQINDAHINSSNV